MPDVWRGIQIRKPGKEKPSGGDETDGEGSSGEAGDARANTESKSDDAEPDAIEGEEDLDEENNFRFGVRGIVSGAMLFDLTNCPTTLPTSAIMMRTKRNG